jgi:hypothetical protein
MVRMKGVSMIVTSPRAGLSSGVMGIP